MIAARRTRSLAAQTPPQGMTRAQVAAQMAYDDAGLGRPVQVRFVAATGDCDSAQIVPTLRAGASSPCASSTTTHSPPCRCSSRAAMDSAAKDARRPHRRLTLTRPPPTGLAAFTRRPG